jgi:hypothetical protein
VKIAVVGAEATGKSVLAASLGKALGLPILAALRESLLKQSGYHTLFEWVAGGNSWASLVAEQAERESQLTAGIVDSGVIDLHASFQRWGWSATSPDRAERLRDLVVAQARGYDKIIVTPPRLVAGFAGGRFRNSAHNQQLARLIDSFLRDAQLPAALHVLADGDFEARHAEALAFVAR